MMSEELERKLKRERVEKCLNCKWFVGCDDIGEYEECDEYSEVDLKEQVVIISLSDYERLLRR